MTTAERELLKRITVDPKIFGGKPIVRGLRISVETIVSLLAQGESVEAILQDYPDLARDDIRACLAYAHAVRLTREHQYTVAAIPSASAAPRPAGTP